MSLKLTASEMEEYNRRFEELQSYIRKHACFYAYKYKQPDKADDLFQEGCLALAKAVKRYNPSFDVTFKNYFLWWIRVYMIGYCIANMYVISVPEDQVMKFNKYNELKRTTDLSDEEIASEIGIKKETILRIVNNIYKAQNQYFSEVDPNLFVNTESVETVVETKLVKERYLALFEEVLDPLEFIIVSRHHGFIGEPTSLNKLRRECIRNGRVLTRERLRQKKESAYKKLRPYLKSLREEYGDILNEK